MTPENFCYWLQGKFELDPTNILNEEQVKDIRQHLALVFIEKCHQIDLSKFNLTSIEYINQLNRNANMFPSHGYIPYASC